MSGKRTFNLEEKAGQLDELILAIGQRLIQFFATKSENLTFREAFLLEILGRRHSAAMGELAAELAVPLTTMTSTVERMVQKGYLQRQRIEEDRRVVLVSLSPAGRDLFEQHRRDYVQSVRSVLGALTEDEQHKILGLIGEVLTVISGNPGG